MSKKKRKKGKIEKTQVQAEVTKGKAGLLQRARLGLRLLSFALFPFADIFHRMDLEWLALLLLLGSALVFYEMLDFYRKIRHWREFFLTLCSYIFAFGSLMLAIFLKASWAHSSNLTLQIVLTLPRIASSYYLCKLLRQVYPYR
ncbi:MAG: hypothetical protein QXT84_06155 [Candidatus Bathyarchaeia archaeon]